MSDLDQAWADYKARANSVALLEAAKLCGATLKRYGGGEHVGPCPSCGGRDRFAVNERKQKWVCRGAGGGGDAIGLVMHVTGLTFAQACRELTGEDPPSGNTEYTPEQKAEWARRKREAEDRDQRRQEEEARDEKARLDIALMLWAEGIPIEGTIAEDYIRRRIKGLEGALPDVLRFHPKCFLERGRSAPAFLARVDNDAGNQVGTWRIYLDPAGDNLRDADGGKIKKGLGPCGGGAVRLHPVEDGHICVCEGIETAFGVHKLTGLPVWPCRTANGLASFEPPFEVERVSIFPDGDKWKWLPDKGRWLDPTGAREALKLADRLRAQGIEVFLQPVPRPGTDFLDIWNGTRAKMEAVV
jgi:putative DNA primase/helicase